MKMLIVAAVVALSGCATTQDFSAKIPGTSIHTCMKDAGATLEGCKQKERKEFNTMVDTFLKGGDCDSLCRLRNRHWY